MDLVRLEALSDYWHVNPPVHVLVAGYFGYRGRAAGALEQRQVQRTGEILDMLATDGK